jgi:hypothetical protein
MTTNSYIYNPGANNFFHTFILQSWIGSGATKRRGMLVWAESWATNCRSFILGRAYRNSFFGDGNFTSMIFLSLKKKKKVHDFLFCDE